TAGRWLSNRDPGDVTGSRRHVTTSLCDGHAEQREIVGEWSASGDLLNRFVQTIRLRHAPRHGFLQEFKEVGQTPLMLVLRHEFKRAIAEEIERAAGRDL